MRKRPGDRNGMWRASRLALPIAMLLGATVGCAPERSGSGLRGFVPKGHAPVDGVSLPEVHPGAAAVPFRFAARPGGLLFVYFGYTSCPDVCPTTLADLRAALHELGADAARVEVAFVTVDVRRDSAEVLAPYLASFVPGSHALRPRNDEDLANAERAFEASSQVRRDAAGKITVSHTSIGYLVDERGRIQLEWSFGTSSKDMAHDLRVLLREPPASRP